MGGMLPFDRHDWYVDRKGQEVRYVIDFYFDEEKAGTADVCPFPCLASPVFTSQRALECGRRWCSVRS